MTQHVSRLNKTQLYSINDSTHYAGNQHRERRHQLNTERQLVELRQQVEQLGTMMGRCLMTSQLRFERLP